MESSYEGNIMANFRKCCRSFLGFACWHWLAALLVILLLGSQASEVMAAGAAPAEKLVNIADTRFMEPGISKWVADLYNTSLFTFGLTVVLVMAVMGIVLGLVCDRLVGLLGLNLGKIQHHE